MQGRTDDVYLRITKAGREYTMSRRYGPDDPWEEAGSWPSIWPAKYVGFMGKTFGSGARVVTDIDSITLTPAPADTPAVDRAEVTVDCDGAAWPLDAMRYGQFIEHMFRGIYGGIWAEMLNNRKFTGGVSEVGVVEGWRPFGQDINGVTFARDNADYYCPAQSQRIEIAEAARPAGIAQDGLTLRAGIGCHVRIVAKQEGIAGPVLVGLRTKETLISQVELRTIGPDWQACEFDLHGPAETTEAGFFIAASGPGTLWLGAVSLMPADSIDGMRADCLEAIREIKPPFVRWPGGNFVSGYDWRDGIGARDSRPPRWNRAWGGWEWNDFGTDEFLRFCEATGTEPYICVNSGEGNATEAAAWVEYCNGPVDSRWGSVRAANGHPDPYKVRIWGIGNEIYGGWQLGHLNATHYGIKAVEFARAMRAVDPSVELIGVGVEGAGWGDWNREVCRIAGSEFDWLSVHYYLHVRAQTDSVLNYMIALSGPPLVERMLGETYDIATEAAGKPMPLAFDEWNIIVDNGAGAYTLRDALFTCSVFNALHRLGDKCPAAALAQLVNVIGAINVTPEGTVRTPIHQAFELYVNNTGSTGVPVRAQVPTAHVPHAGAVDALDVTATLSDDGRTLYVAAINRLPSDSVPTKLTLKGFSPAGQVRVLTLTAEDFEAVNTLQSPREVAIRETQVPLQSALAYRFPAHSATVMVFSR